MIDKNSKNIYGGLTLSEFEKLKTMNPFERKSFLDKKKKQKGEKK